MVFVFPLSYKECVFLKCTLRILGYLYSSIFPYFCPMLQPIIIGILLMASVAYLGRILFRAFKGQSHCETGCAKCGDINKSLEGAHPK
jgi:hypothetical protein